ncbi:uncharacterized protein LOC115217647 [Octopus sinensis]|uniref:Uncharacterized protein LOC115217647 n=1 Tax=Octopus sinensis TaxID=2607531 RepID=A0A6P7SXZ4_9MOLL|nr:uncharacterized protein LOC115217647 [Octopus sinensis]
MWAQLYGDHMSASFSLDILKTGDSEVPLDSTKGMEVDLVCNIVNTAGDLTMTVFPILQENYKNHDWLCETAILTLKNSTVNKINEHLLLCLPEFVHTFKSVDTIQNPKEVVHYLTEFLNSLEPLGLPPHQLSLKVGTPVMLLRNLEPSRLCNGTCLVVKKMRVHVIEATILSRCGKGEDVFIPQIPLTLSISDIHFLFRRLQFPIHISFGTSINKLQDHTLFIAGIHLEEPCFSHGQLHIACS